MTNHPTPHHPRALGAATTTFHRFLFLVSALPLAGVWLAVLLGGWALALGLAITPLVFGWLIGFGATVRFVAWVEGFLARRLLRAPAYPRRKGPGHRNYWRAGSGTLRDRRFWRAQAYGWLRVTFGLVAGVLTLGVLAAGLGAVGAPILFRFIPDDGGGRNGLDLGFWKVDSLGESLLLIPPGIALLAAGIGLVHLFGSIWRRIAVRVLGGNND